ncbi:MAG: HEAT repeat domain-containing protein, partial [Anaerolineae bacterium]|nr:HEAT repeat domain-containing protein [Anaerolineae bacterium]
MSQKLTQLILLFEQLEAWDTQGRRSISVAPVFSSPDNLLENDGTPVETPLSQTVNKYNDLTTQIRELADNEQAEDILLFLMGHLQHIKVLVRLQAVEALGYTRNTGAISPLVDAMEHDSDNGVKAAAAQSLGIIGNILATPFLVEVLQSEMRSPSEAKVRWMSAEALSFIADPSAIDPLLEALSRNYTPFEKEASDIREAARDALVSINGEVVTDKLIELFGKPILHSLDYIDESIRHEIIMGLGQIDRLKALNFLLTLA